MIIFIRKLPVFSIQVVFFILNLPLYSIQMIIFISKVSFVTLQVMKEGQRTLLAIRQVVLLVASTTKLQKLNVKINSIANIFG